MIVKVASKVLKQPMEIFIPESNIGINVAGVNKVNYFRSDDDRYSTAYFVKDVDFPSNIVDLINKQLKDKEDIVGPVISFFKKLSGEFPKPKVISTPKK